MKILVNTLKQELDAYNLPSLFELGHQSYMQAPREVRTLKLEIECAFMAQETYLYDKINEKMGELASLVARLG